MGKCYLAFGDNIESISEWTKSGPFRFYFSEKYNPSNYNHEEVPMQARKLGTLGKGKGDTFSKLYTHIFITIRPSCPLNKIPN